MAMLVLSKADKEYAVKLFDEATQDKHILSERAKRMTIQFIGECLTPKNGYFGPLEDWMKLVVINAFYWGYQDALIKEGLMDGIEREA